MRIMVFTDTWEPQVNGVVAAWRNTKKVLERWGHEIKIVHPNMFRTFPLPTYPEIGIAYSHIFSIKGIVESFSPDAIHIATEASIGLAARRYCHKNNIAYTTSYHTKLPEYIKERVPFPLSWGYAAVRKLHERSHAVLVSTLDVKSELEELGVKNVIHWPKGVDRELFHPDKRQDLSLPRPVFLYVGRVSVEKSLEQFLELDLGGSQVVVGEGPQLEEYRKRFTHAHLLGMKKGEELARYYASADVFVFPSVTDTLGLVLFESIASGTPVAAYDCTGPRDVITDGVNGYTGDDLRQCALDCLEIDREACRESSAKWDWAESAQIFLNNLVQIR